jgi:hypothetical protein
MPAAQYTIHTDRMGHSSGHRFSSLTGIFRRDISGRFTWDGTTKRMIFLTDGHARIHVTSGLFHVISRFHDRRYYLDIEGARQKYLELLGKAADTHDGRIIAYCLMSSHVHFVMQLAGDPIGLLTFDKDAAFSFCRPPFLYVSPFLLCVYI